MIIKKIKNLFKKIKPRKFKEYSEIEIKTLRLIGKFLTTKKTIEELKNLEITHIKIFNKTLSIYLGRPGLLIGKKGILIEELEKYLSKEINIKKIKIFEDNIELYLIPYFYEEV